MGLGTNDMTGTTLAVYRPNVWAKETLAARESNLVLVPRVKHYDRDIKSAGQTVEIPNLSNLTANLKVANTQVTLNGPTETKTTITINQHYESSFLLEDFAEIQSAYDAASEYTSKTGYALAEKMDSYVATGITNGAAQTIGTAGTVLTSAIILTANRYLDDAKAPSTERYLVVTPKGKQELLGIDTFTRWDALGTGDAIKTGKIGELYGIEVSMSQNLVVTAGTPDVHNHLLFHKEAYAIAVQKDITFESQRKTEYLGTLYVAQSLWGGSILRDDHAVVVRS
jgi:N4-gp56 family major capsid protein